jgi:hypothetical protein
MRDTFAWFYQNTSHKLRLTERVPFELLNMRIEGEPPGTSDVVITLEPGESKLLVVRQEKVRAQPQHALSASANATSGGCQLMRTPFPQACASIKWFAKPEASIHEVDTQE